MEKHRFHYHASAHALSGELTRPVQHMIEVQAGISLPSTGGVGSSHVENFRVDEVVSFKRGYSHVSGSVKKENGTITHTTHATAAIEGLNILDLVTADRIVARLSSSYEEPAPNKPKPSEGKVLLIGSKFENLRIAGCQTDVELHHSLFLDLDTFGAAQAKWNEEEFRMMVEDTRTALEVGEALPQELKLDRALLCSIVKEVHFKEPGFEKSEKEENQDQEGKKKKGKGQKEYRQKHPCPGVERIGRHRFRVVDFGNIFLAEVLCHHGRKTLTMLRVELGSPNGGGFTGPEASSNGLPPW